MLSCLDFFPPCDATRMQPSKQRSALGCCLTPATRHPRRIYLPSCETACNLFSPSRKVSEPAGCLLLRKHTHTHTLNSQPGWGRRVIFISTPSCNQRRDGRTHDGDDTWTALEQVDSPSGSSTCGGGSFHFNAALPVVDIEHTGGRALLMPTTPRGWVTGVSRCPHWPPQGEKEKKKKKKKALLNEPI